MPARATFREIVMPFFPLTPAERALLGAINAGTSAREDEDMEMYPHPAFLSAYGPKNTIRAELVRQLCLSEHVIQRLPPRGLVIRGAMISGDLDLVAATVSAPLQLIRCAIPGFIDLTDARMRSVVLSGSHVGAITGNGCTIDGRLTFDQRFVCTGGIEMAGAVIKGDVHGEKAHLLNPSGDALNLNSAEVHGNVFLNGLHATGEIWLAGASIRGSLECRGARISCVDLTNDTSRERSALFGDRLAVGGSLHLNYGFSADGEVRLRECSVGGNFSCRGGHFSNPLGDALSCHRMKVSSDVRLDRVPEDDASDYAITFTADGSVVFLGATVGGEFWCSGGAFTPGRHPDPADDIAFHGGRMRVSGSLHIDAGFTAGGQVRLKRADIGGNLVCYGASFVVPDSISESAVPFSVINAKQVRIGGGAFFGYDSDNQLLSRSDGVIDLYSASIGGDLVIDGVQFSEVRSNGLSVEHAKIGGSLKWTSNTVSEQTEINLAHAAASHLDDRRPENEDMWESNWPTNKRVVLEGFVYEDILDDPATDGWVKRRTTWINASNVYSAQPFEQLANVLRQNGYDSQAREISIAKRDALIASKKLSSRATMWNRCLGMSVRHGYEPWRPLPVGVLVIVVGTILFSIGFSTNDMVATSEIERETNRVEWVLGLMYSLDTFLPIIDFRLANEWQPTTTSNFGFALWLYAWLEIALGWLISTLFVLGFTGLIRRD